MPWVLQSPTYHHGGESDTLFSALPLRACMYACTPACLPACLSACHLSPLVNSRTRNKLVLAAYLEHCTEEVTAGDAAEPSSSTQSELWQQHEQHSSARAVAVQAALQVKARRTAAKKEAQQAAGTITITTPTDSDEDGEGGEEGEEEETESHIYPLPASVSPQSLTGGLSMSGRRPVRKTIAFAVDIKHAEAMNAVFNAAGVFDQGGCGRRLGSELRVHVVAHLA